MKDEKKSRKELLAEIQSLRMENSRLKKGLMRTNRSEERRVGKEC